MRDSGDADAGLRAWLIHVRALDWDTLLLPTRSRGRSLRNLTVNVFHPFELLPGAWAGGEFDWRPDQDGLREERLFEREQLIRFADSAAAGWREFLDEHGHELETHDPLIGSPRGSMPFSALLSFQRWHLAYHYRQLAASLRIEPTFLDLLADLGLPSDVF